MARHFLAALALVHSAAALHNGFGHLALKADVATPPDLANFVADLGDAAAADGQGSNACQTADAAVRSCYLAGVLEATGGFSDARDCVCCHSKTALVSAYGSCASYLHEVLPNEKTAYVAASAIYSVCSEAGPGLCATATAFSRSRTATATSASAIITVPPACLRMVGMYNSCYESSGDMVECLCHDPSDKFNTAIEDLASSCAPWAKTADPEDYPIITRLASVCDEAGPTKSATGSALVFTAVSRTETEGPASSATDDATATSTDDAAATTTDDAAAASSTDAETTSTSSGLAAPGAAVPGLFGSIASLGTFILSFFILV
ncbi:hypothetical protein BT67DRAFT_441888 [Trichocladium antarcticum]|uniref:Extracellular membrane protein CFEM domain-containing protein n=1 Tax=Trichocladium antarcticum TaxID=1450529 RepID=A0AAN6UKK4_9PEZI|nr:hypothetical protein BT67DRAFT_441888 [Trichocladium antarcticum]